MHKHLYYSSPLNFTSFVCLTRWQIILAEFQTDGKYKLRLLQEKIQILFSKFMRVFKQCALRLNCCQLFDARKVRTLHKRADRAVFAQMSSLYRFRGYIRYCAYFVATQVKDSNGSAHSAVLTLMLRAGFEPGPLIS